MNDNDRLIIALARCARHAPGVKEAEKSESPNVPYLGSKVDRAEGAEYNRLRLAALQLQGKVDPSLECK